MKTKANSKLIQAELKHSKNELKQLKLDQINLESKIIIEAQHDVKRFKEEHLKTKQQLN